MKNQVFRIDSDGFNGAWYPVPGKSGRGLIIMLWDTCRYIRRMEKRLGSLPHDSAFESWLYEHGMHFAFPESMLKMMLPVSSGLLVSYMFRAGKEHKIEMFEAYGIRGLCKIFCMTDTTSYENLRRHVTFIRHSDLSDGNACQDKTIRRRKTQ